MVGPPQGCQYLGVKGSRVQIPPSRLVGRYFSLYVREPIGEPMGFRNRAKSAWLPSPSRCGSWPSRPWREMAVDHQDSARVGLHDALAGMRRVPMKIRQEDTALLIQGLPFQIAQPVQSHAQMPEHLRAGCRGHTGRRDRAPRAEPDLARAGWFVPRMVRPVYRRQAAIKIVREMPATRPTEWSAPMTSSMIDQLDDGFVQDPTPPSSGCVPSARSPGPPCPAAAAGLSPATRTPAPRWPTRV